MIRAAVLDAGIDLRPLLQAQGVASSGGLPAIMIARYTNANGPLPDRIFRNGFN